MVAGGNWLGLRLTSPSTHDGGRVARCGVGHRLLSTPGLWGLANTRIERRWSDSLPLTRLGLLCVFPFQTLAAIRGDEEQWVWPTPPLEDLADRNGSDLAVVGPTVATLLYSLSANRFHSQLDAPHGDGAACGRCSWCLTFERDGKACIELCVSVSPRTRTGPSRSPVDAVRRQPTD